MQFTCLALSTTVFIFTSLLPIFRVPRRSFDDLFLTRNLLAPFARKTAIYCWCLVLYEAGQNKFQGRDASLAKPNCRTVLSIL